MEGVEVKLWFTEECQLMKVEDMIEKEKKSFCSLHVIMNSGKGFR